MTTQHASYWTYSGNYGKTEPRGIYLMHWNGDAGKLGTRGLAAEAQNPNFVITHPNGRFVYAVTAARLADYSGTVEAFAVDPETGRLKLLNRQPSGGDNPAHLAIDPSGRLLVTANYSGGTVGVFPVQPDGTLSPASAVIQHHGSSVNPERQGEPHPHCVAFNSTGNTLLVPDLGVDHIYRYRVNLDRGSLTGIDPAVSPPGSGPRHVVLGAGERFAYVINEMTATITVFEFSPEGPMREVETIAAWPAGEQGGAEIAIHPNGRILYASNRGPDSIAICAIDPATGKLQPRDLVKTGGKHPRHFGIDPTGRYLLASNMNSDTIVVFQMDEWTGALVPTEPRIAAEAPCCLAFIAAPR